VYAIVDTSGENEVWRYASDGSGKGEQLTSFGDNHRLALYPSPDGRWVAHTDKRGRTWLLDVASKTNVIIDDAGQSGFEGPDQVQWSPDSKNLAFLRASSTEVRDQIGLFSMATRKLVFVTSDRFNASSPAFSPDGRWLYFLSARNFQLANSSPWGDRNMGPVFDKRTGVYALALQPGNRFPFKPDDELSVPAPDPAAVAAADAAKAVKPSKPVVETKPVKPSLPEIVYEGLAARIYEVPLASGNYQSLAVSDKHLYFLEADGNEGKHTLKTLAIARTAPQPEVFVANVREFDLSADMKHLFYRSYSAGGPGDILIVDAGAKQQADISRAKVKVDDWSITLDPRLEWKQMYNDAWRMHRDFLYDVNMRGVNWVAVRDKYAPLVGRVTDRAELNDILGMMVSEVGALHSQVAPGDLRKSTPDGIPAGLGAMLTRVADGYRVDRIYRSEPEMPSERGPLAQPDVDVREGDIITAVNGRETAKARDIADLLLSQGDKQVLLHVKRGAAAPKAMMVTPVTMARQAALRYSDWEQGRADAVANATKGRVGYLHLRAMGGRDMAAFAREFYANIQREGLIIDVRRNNGGNIDSWIIEKLLRKPWSFFSYGKVLPYSNMQATFRGQLVVLVDEFTYSDGETFAAAVKALKLGPLVGKRTAGAGVFLTDRNRLADNGMVRVAEFGQFAADGQWLIEGVGVVPDIEVDNLPHATFQGQDRQLEVALEMIEQQLKASPYKPHQPAAIPALKY
jgi:tricorn protease